MIYLILDTNIWLYLANGLDPISNKNHGNGHIEFLARLKELQKNSSINILVNDIILEEWSRNKEHANQYIKTLEGKLKKSGDPFKDIKRYAATDMRQIEQEYTKGLRKEIELNKRHIISVEDFLNNGCTKIPINDGLKLKIFDFSLSKKAPFHNNKNNIADASILFCSSEYLNLNPYSEEMSAIFVSNNIADFTDGKDTNQFHPDLIEMLAGNIQYQRVLPAALKLSEKILNEIEEYRKQEEWLASVMFSCRTPLCEGQEDYKPWGYLDHEVIVKSKRQLILDHGQQEIFEDLTITIDDKKTPIGSCNSCEVIHFECVYCEDLVLIEFEDHQVICDNCNSTYEVNYEFDGILLIHEDTGMSD